MSAARLFIFNHIATNMSSGHRRLKISVVIATFNEQKNIGRCLKSLRHQTLSPNQMEIIVVDNQSTDKTVATAKKLADRIYLLSPNKQIKNSRGAQLNFGVAKSHGGIIFFPDADMTFDKKLLEEAFSLVCSKKIGALYIPEVIKGKGFFGKIRNFERSFYNATCIDAVRIVTKKLYQKVGGFDDKNIRFGPDDWDFTKRIKLLTDKISITRNKLYHHEENLKMATYFSKKSNYSQSFKEYIAKWGTGDPDIKKQFGLVYRYFTVYVENGKWRYFISALQLTIGLYFIRSIVGLNHLRQFFFKNENE